MTTSVLPRALASFRLALALSVAAGGAMAATTTTTFQVTATVNPACVVSASNLAFGIYDPAATTALDGTTTLLVTCSNGTSYNIGLDRGAGQQATVAQRKLTNTNQNYLIYSLYQDAARTAVWGETIGVDTVAGAGAGVAQTLTVYGRIPAQQTVTPASFTDTITVTLTY